MRYLAVMLAGLALVAAGMVGLALAPAQRPVTPCTHGAVVVMAPLEGVRLGLTAADRARAFGPAHLEVRETALDQATRALTGAVLPRGPDRVDMTEAEDLVRLLAARGTHRVAQSQTASGVSDWVAALRVARVVARGGGAGPHIDALRSGLVLESYVVTTIHQGLGDGGVLFDQALRLVAEARRATSEWPDAIQIVNATVRRSVDQLEHFGRLGCWKTPLTGARWLALWCPEDPVRRADVLRRAAEAVKEHGARALVVLAGNGTLVSPPVEPLPNDFIELVVGVSLVDTVIDGWDPVQAEARVVRMLTSRFKAPVVEIADKLTLLETQRGWLAQAAARLTGATR